MDPGDGLLILDDTTLDKPYANEIEHVTWHWSGKHDDVVKGINLLTLLWRGSSEEDPIGGPPSEESLEEPISEEASRETHVPCDFRLYEKDGKTKNEHFREMLDRAARCSTERPTGSLGLNTWFSTVGRADWTTSRRSET